MVCNQIRSARCQAKWDGTPEVALTQVDPALAFGCEAELVFCRGIMQGTTQAWHHSALGTCSIWHACRQQRAGAALFAKVEEGGVHLGQAAARGGLPGRQEAEQGAPHLSAQRVVLQLRAGTTHLLICFPPSGPGTTALQAPTQPDLMISHLLSQFLHLSPLSHACH